MPGSPKLGSWPEWIKTDHFLIKEETSSLSMSRTRPPKKIAWFLNRNVVARQLSSQSRRREVAPLHQLAVDHERGGATI